MDLLDIIGTSLVSIGIFIFVPLLLYSLYQFYHIGSEEIMKHRKKKLIYSMNILSIIALIIIQPLSIHINVLKLHRFQTRNIASEWIIYIAQSLFIGGIFALFLCKMWLLYYKKKYHLSLASQHWEQHINLRFNSWYIANKNTWGNATYIMKLLSIPLILCISIESLIEHYFFLQLHNNSIIILFLIFLIPSVLIYLKLKDIDDVYCVKKEIYYECIVMCVVITLYALAFAVEVSSSFFIRSDQTFSFFNARIFNIISTSIGYITLFLIPILSTAYPTYLHKAHIMESLLAKRLSESKSSSTNAMLKYISHYKGYRAFMQHLVKEWSTELLLFLTELIQIKYAFQVKHNKILKLPINTQNSPSTPTDQETASYSEYHTIDFHVAEMHDSTFMNIELKTIQSSSVVEMIPASSYLFDKFGAIFCRIKLPIGIPLTQYLKLHRNNFKKQLYELYLKYIKVGSIHEINISSSERRYIEMYFEQYNVDEKYDDETDCEIFNIMDGACIEIIKLAHSSYSRFCKTKHFVFDNKSDEMFDGVSFMDGPALSESVHKDSSYSQLQRQYKM